MLGGNKRVRPFPSLILIAAFLAASSAGEVFAYTPESPKVKQLIKKATAYLDTAKEERWGGVCLIGLIYFKQGGGESHSKVQAAIKMTQKICKDSPSKIISRDSTTYSHGIAIIFLCEIGPQKYSYEIEKLLQALYQRQKPNGSWGYNGSKDGDTSQTQYGVLACWAARHAGYSVPPGVVSGVCNWLLRSQDISGGWAYIGKDPGEGVYTRVNQLKLGAQQIRHPIVVAGVGSVYVCADLLGVFSKDEKKVVKTGLPPALKLVKQMKTKRRQGSGLADGEVDEGILRKSVADGDRWIQRNYRMDPVRATFYYLYGLERYMSFRAKAEKSKEKEPKWYNDGVNYLAQTQSPKGTWNNSQSGEAMSTAFAVLFLMRSTQGTIAKVALEYGDGTMIGGRDLPTDLRAVSMKRGKVTGNQINVSIKDFIEMAEKSSDSNLANMAEGDLKLSEDENKKLNQVKRLQSLLSEGSYESRLVSVRALARTGDLDRVPDLIYALSDGDYRVVKEARDGLRFISRKLGGFGLDEPTALKMTTQVFRQRVQKAENDWKKWYQSIRPDAEILD